MKHFFLALALASTIALSSPRPVEAGRKHRIYYYAPHSYYRQPPVIVYDPVFVAPPPVIFHRPVYAPYPRYRAVYQQPLYLPRKVRYRRRGQEVEIKYKRTRYGYKVEYEFDD